MVAQYAAIQALWVRIETAYKDCTGKSPSSVNAGPQSQKTKRKRKNLLNYFNSNFKRQSFEKKKKKYDLPA